MVEQAVAQGMIDAGLCDFTPLAESAGLLGFQPAPIDASAFRFTLITGRLPSEVDATETSRIWSSAAKLSGEEGSWAEKRFFEDVLVPVLGFPLLDYLRFQTDLTDLGVKSTAFTRQRTDFCPCYFLVLPWIIGSGWY